MKKLLTAASLFVLVLLLSSCAALLPADKEFFQKKVPSFPDKDKKVEIQKQTAAVLATKVDQAYDAGLAYNIDSHAMAPLAEAHVLARPLSESLGQPLKPYTGDVTNLVGILHILEAKYDAALSKLETKLDGLEGKKIEGTGAIQIPYFLYLAIIVGVGALLVFIFKIVAIANPPLAIAGTAVSAGAGLVKRGFGEMIEGGEHFKDLVAEKFEDPKLQAHILDLFRQAHMTKQSRDVQDVVKALTAKDATTEATKSLLA